MANRGERFRILVAGELSGAAVAQLSAAGQVIVVGEGALPAGDLAAAEAIVVRTHTKVTREVLESAPRLRVIGRAGVGLDNVDVAAARERGIEVVYTPEANSRAVAELAVGLIVALRRGLLAGDAAVRGGAFTAYREGQRVAELRGQTVGIIGMGRAGRATARILQRGFGMRVVFNDIVEITGLDFPAEAVSKAELYAAAAVVSLHVPLTELTRGLIGRAAIAAMRPGALLINTARGAVVDGAAVAEALRSGKLGGAAFDVFEPEPPAADDPLLSAPNCLLSPHVGARTVEAQAAMNAVVEDVIAVLEGRRPRYAAP